MDGANISVIIPFVNGIEDIRGCLDALSRQEGVSLQVVVVERLGQSAREAVQKSHPDVIVLSMARTATIPQMRKRGFERATADAVAVLEDHVLVPKDWARRLLNAFAAGADVAGGPIENAATQTRVDWAAFLCEYSACLPPLAGGESTWLPGNNIAYRRELLEKYKPVIAECKWENRLHDAMRADGVKLIMLPDLIVGHKMHYTFNLYLSQRYLYARSYAGARVREKSLPVRLIYGAAALALPAIVFIRTIQRIRSKRRHLEHLGPSLPMISAFTLSWGWGEVVGYWFGAGDSLSKVR